MICKNCKYYNPDAEGLPEQTGQCLLLPPAVLANGSFYPVVSEESFCSKYTMKNHPMDNIEPGAIKTISPIVRRKK